MNEGRPQPAGDAEARVADDLGLTVEQALVQAGAWPPTDRTTRRRLARLVRKAEKRTKKGRAA